MLNLLTVTWYNICTAPSHVRKSYVGGAGGKPVLSPLPNSPYYF